MPKDTPDELVFAGPMLEENGRRSMSELMWSDPQPCGLLDPLGDLFRECPATLWCVGLAWEKPGLVRAPNQGGPEVMDIFVDQLGHLGIQRKLKCNAVFDVVVREYQEVPHQRRLTNCGDCARKALGEDIWIETDALGVDAQGELYWHGKPVEIQRPPSIFRFGNSSDLSRWFLRPSSRRLPNWSKLGLHIKIGRAM